LFISVFCFGRDNPFVAVNNITKFTQINKKEMNFEDVKMQLPNSARILKSIEVVYQNLDGSVDKKVKIIDKKIDWHDELIFTKTTKSKEKAVTQMIPRSTQEQAQKYSFRDFIKFEVSKKSFKIITKDIKIRDFLVSQPYKVVVDFKRDANFLTKRFVLNTPPFVSVVLGNHDKYYRVAIKLDGQYAYLLKKEKGDYIITLK
jgi:hypothetical protein